MVETPGVPLSVYLGYSMRWLHQEELTWFRNLIWEKPKALETWSWKSAAAWELGRRTEMFKVFVEQRRVLRTQNNTDELHRGKCFSTTFLFRDWEDWSGCWEHRDRARMPGHQLCPQHGWHSHHSSLQSPGRHEGHSRHSCRLLSSLGPSKLSHSRARGAWGQCNPGKFLNSIMVSLYLWETKKIKQDWIEGAQAGILIHLATVGQSFPCRTYVSNMHTGRIQFLKVTKIFVEIHVFYVGNLQDIDGSIIFLFFPAGTYSTVCYM